MTGLLALAFAAGMLAPINPCGIALLPAWISQTLGAGQQPAVAVRLLRALRAAAALTLGFAGTLSVAGLAVSAGAHALISAAPKLGLAVGVVLLLLGLAMLTNRIHGPRLRLPGSDLHPAGRASGAWQLVVFGVGYAAASLSCSFGVLLAVIAQAQATSYAGQLAVFAAYAAGAAALLLVICVGTAGAGAAISARLHTLARQGNRITASILILTGAYLTWYWYPAATGRPAQADALTGLSAAATSWIQTHQGLIATWP